MNRLIFDCGSTKCKIVLLENEKYISHHSIGGFNPILHEDIITATHHHFKEISKTIRESIDSIEYCGAGCVGEKIKVLMAEGLTKVFSCSEVTVSDDLSFIPRVLNINDPCIIGILGTGSNAGFWNGKEVQMTVSGGYLLGDEGSAFTLGKKLIINYIRGNFQKSTQKQLANEIKIGSDDLLKMIYNHKSPNQFIASFAKYYEMVEDEYLDRILLESLREYIGARIKPYQMQAEFIHLFGSVAYFNRSLLIPLIEELNLQVGIISREPLDLIIPST